MILKRKLYSEMLKWKKESNGSSALLISGARRVGKSYLCNYFGKNEYKSIITVDFANIPNEVRNAFEYDSADLDVFFAKLSVYYRIPLYERQSLIIFDEVQLLPKARQMLKYLVADGKYDYIETGSLLSIKQNVQDIIIPSEEEEIEMFPMDFEEFLWAMGDEVTAPFLRDCFENRKPLGQALHRRVMNDFRQYLLVGGMPQAVIAYIANKDFSAADRAKKRILTLYRNDIAKYAGVNKGKVTSIFDALPGQLSRKEKKYNLSSISKDARTREYEDAFMWLDDGMIVNPCYNATDPNVGLALSGDHSKQKLYMCDTGLLITHTFRDNRYTDNELYRAILLDKLNINEGMVMENVVAQMLRSNGRRLFFYSRGDSNNRPDMIEIDFLIARNNRISPVEVKSSAYRTHSSLDKFKRKFAPTLGDAFILYTKDVMVRDDIIHLPVYMAMFL
ncbi:MAG: AAA family ATPase [Oscillospiraceae bacterium]|jgi:predicted AAA+ superfamily ATPase|nr:AAA family ATPase [Oscillospiraceae bacterium]